MSFSNDRFQPDGELAFGLVRDVYLQGAPVWPIREWVDTQTINYVAAGARRFSGSWRKHYAKVMREARKYRKEILAKTPKETLEFHLMELGPLLLQQVDEQLAVDLPAGWDREETRDHVFRGLKHVGKSAATEEERREKKILTTQEKNCFHLGCVITGRGEAGEIMGISPKTVTTHVTNAFGKIAGAGINSDALRWALSGRLPKRPRS